MLLLPPLRLRLLLTRDERTAFRLVLQCARAVLRLAGCRVSVRHVERVPADGSVMFVSNHVSLADAAVLLAFMPFDLRFVSNHVFAQYPLLGAAIRAASAHIAARTERPCARLSSAANEDATAAKAARAQGPLAR